MENKEYQKKHNYPKAMNKPDIPCATQGEQRVFNAHAIFNSNEQFKVIQVRKGHIRKTDLSYVLMYKSSSVMLRIDIIGATHQGIPTPHVHIYDVDHEQGCLAIPLSQLKGYLPTSNIVDSLVEFLKYNNFDLKDVQIYEPTV